MNNNLTNKNDPLQDNVVKSSNILSIFLTKISSIKIFLIGIFCGLSITLIFWHNIIKIDDLLKTEKIQIIERSFQPVYLNIHQYHLNELSQLKEKQAIIYSQFSNHHQSFQKEVTNFINFTKEKKFRKLEQLGIEILDKLPVLIKIDSSTDQSNVASILHTISIMKELSSRSIITDLEKSVMQFYPLYESYHQIENQINKKEKSIKLLKDNKSFLSDLRIEQQQKSKNYFGDILFKLGLILLIGSFIYLILNLFPPKINLLSHIKTKEKKSSKPRKRNTHTTIFQKDKLSTDQTTVSQLLITILEELRPFFEHFKIGISLLGDNDHLIYRHKQNLNRHLLELIRGISFISRNNDNIVSEIKIILDQNKKIQITLDGCEINKDLLDEVWTTEDGQKLILDDLFDQMELDGFDIRLENLFLKEGPFSHSMIEVGLEYACEE